MSVHASESPFDAEHARLASPSDRIAATYDAIVVGSGYGGAIAAYHLAQAGQRVCVLERGRERLPGEYPKTERDILSAVRVASRVGGFGAESALFD
ncbi:MAG: Cholesterol oxidase, partial [Myxococcaceae bacterium]|nr:Cholesterol oxidase [Myxococcaceae bacterium]